MTQNKKFGLIIIFTVLLPLSLIYLNSTKSSIKNFEWGYDHVNDISSAGLLIAIIGCLAVVYLNYSSQTPKSFWYSIPLALAFGLLIILFAGNSISNIGF